MPTKWVRTLYYALSQEMSDPVPIAYFPYSTLFRSSSGRAGPSLAAVLRPGASRRRTGASRRRTGASPASYGRERRDRKSTRLNSSHVRNSYAVFCLKKKKAYQYQEEKKENSIENVV